MKRVAERQKHMMTVTEAYGRAVAVALEGANTFAKAEHEKALAEVFALEDAGQIDRATSRQVQTELGNVSAIRQHCEKHALITPPADAKAIAVREARAKRAASAKAVGEEFGKKQEGKK